MDFVFDLDGTLVDSAPAIRHCLVTATEAIAPECTPQAMLVPIGPPLKRMAELILQDSFAERRQEFVEAFVRLYDDEGIRRTGEYPGVTKALQVLADHGSRMAIVTNKREKPTLRILDALGWSRHFLKVLCTDTAGYDEMDKAARLATLLRQVLGPDCAMVGDTLEDYRAAAANTMPFVAADYGYETDRIMFAEISAILRLTTSESLSRLASLRGVSERGANATFDERGEAD